MVAQCAVRGHGQRLSDDPGSSCCGLVSTLHVFLHRCCPGPAWPGYGLAPVIHSCFEAPGQYNTLL